jgi:RNA polymerase sigma-70 factor (ECF subfamily)
MADIISGAGGASPFARLRETLVRACSNDDKVAALAEFASSWMLSELRRFFFGCGANADDHAREVLQNFFATRANKFVQRYDPRRDLEPLLRTYLLKLAQDFRRRLATQTKRKRPLSGDDIPAKDSPPDEAFAGNAELEEAREKLGPAYELFELHHAEGLTIEQVAARLGLSERAVRSRMFRAQRRLRGPGAAPEPKRPATRERTPVIQALTRGLALSASSGEAPRRLVQKLVAVQGARGLDGLAAQLTWHAGVRGEWVQDTWWLTLAFPLHVGERAGGAVAAGRVARRLERLRAFDGRLVRLEWREDSRPWVADEARLELVPPGNLVSSPMVLRNVDPTRPARVRLITRSPAAELSCD